MSRGISHGEYFSVGICPIYLQYIPKTQAAYQFGRSTIEHVFVIKLLAEIAITSQYLTIYLLKFSQYYVPSWKTSLITLKQALQPKTLKICFLCITLLH